MNILPGNMRFGAGQPVKRLEDQRLLTGKGQFIDDKPDDGALWLHVLRSPHAHARIVSIDTTAAAGMPGVEAVYTGDDLIADNIGTIPTLTVFMRPDGKPMTVPPRRLLAHEIVRFAGEAFDFGLLGGDKTAQGRSIRHIRHIGFRQPVSKPISYPRSTTP